MEESVGKIWDRVIRRAARDHFPQASITLEEMLKPVAVLFRALGGDGGLRVEAATAKHYGTRRNWLQRLAGTGARLELPFRNEQALRLPSSLAVFPEQELNRELYLWLAALASQATVPDNNWFAHNQWLTCRVLQYYPGLKPRYQRLLQAQLALRPALEQMKADAAAQERAIQQALSKPGSVESLPAADNTPQPVWMWLYPAPEHLQGTTRSDDDNENSDSSVTGENQRTKDRRRRQGQRVDMPDGRKGLLFYRFETILSWAEYVKVDRCTDDEEDMDAAELVLDDLDNISVAQDNNTAARRLKFDLDLPSAAEDDQALGKGILFPEWDYTQQQILKDYVSVQPMLARSAEPCGLPPHLRKMAQRIRAQFEALTLSPTWHHGQTEGNEVDMDAYLQHLAHQVRGNAQSDEALYKDFRRGTRDMACLMLADMSLSTDTWINNEMRVIDVIRDALYLFAEALAATGDRFAMYGFSSRKRQHVRINWLKGFKENYNGTVRGRLSAIKPGYYTRMGAAIRYATQTLQRQPASQKLLLILTDGKPNDLDKYEGRYGSEDTRRAIIEARQQGIRPFCVTIDDEATDYLPYIFGSSSFVVIRQPAELPRRLPLLYAQLTS